MKTDGDYYVDGDRKVPRVTAILGRWFDPAAVAATWVAQESARLAQAASEGRQIEVIDSVWTGSRFEWCAERKDPLALLRDQRHMVGAYWRGRQAAMDRGTLTNDFIDQWVAGFRPTYDEVPDWCDQRFEEGKMMDGAKHPTPWKADRDDLIDHVCCSLKWLSDTVPDIRATQVFLECETHAGTADAIGAHGGVARIYEFKTGAPNRSHALQVAGGYAPIAERMLEVELLPTIVYFTGERYREVEVSGEYRDWCVAQFQRELETWEFSKRETPWENKKSVPMGLDDFPFTR